VVSTGRGYLIVVGYSFVSSYKRLRFTSYNSFMQEACICAWSASILVLQFTSDIRQVHGIISIVCIIHIEVRETITRRKPNS
jgi:hypothetical protein